MAAILPLLTLSVLLHNVVAQDPPLLVFYSYTRQNNAVVATAASIAEVLNDTTYSFVDTNAYVVSNVTQAPGTIPLMFYRNPTSLHTLTTASSQGIAYAAANGFVLQRVEGYVFNYTTDTANYLTLEMWFSSARGDMFLVGSTENRDNAIAAGYVKLWDDCSVPFTWLVWPNAPPLSNPFPASTDLLDWEYAFGRNAVPPGIGADTWYPSWASDGNMYSSWTDGTVNGVSSSSTQLPKHNATTGMATIMGDDPFNLTITNVSIYAEPATPYQGRYPCGSVVYNGSWYYGTYSLENYQAGVNPAPDCGNWCVQGPFTGFRRSDDAGATWTPSPRRFMVNGTDNLFGENAFNNGKVKFGAPHVVDFGQNMQHSPQPGMMYIIGHGAQREDAHESWMQGDQVYMARVMLTPENANNGSAYEFFAGNPGPNALWSSNLSDAQPLFTWENHTGVVTLTYVPALGKYIMCVGTPTDSPSMVGPFDTYFLESNDITGPWAMVSYLSTFGPEAYFVHYPSRWQGASARVAPRASMRARVGGDVAPQPTAPVRTHDGSQLELATMHAQHRVEAVSAAGVSMQSQAGNATYFNGYLSYSANFASGGNNPNPPGSGYHWSLQAYRIMLSPSFAARLQG